MFIVVISKECPSRIVLMYKSKIEQAINVHDYCCKTLSEGNIDRETTEQHFSHQKAL